MNQLQGCVVLEIDGVDPKRALLELRDGKFWDGEPATRKEDGTAPMPDGFYFVEQRWEAHPQRQTPRPLRKRCRG